jgi:uncharacterized protein
LAILTIISACEVSVYLFSIANPTEGNTNGSITFARSFNKTMNLREEQIVRQTQNWIKDVVIGCNFCPFASKVFIEKTIRYVLIEGTALHTHAAIVLDELQFLDQHPEVETTLVIFAEAYEHFSSYLAFLKQIEKLSSRKGYEGVYQIASFHPQYVFEAADENDAANYTNRSPYPMLHLLREASLSKAIAYHPDAEGIPARNITYAQEKGVDFMQQLLAQSMAR